MFSQRKGDTRNRPVLCATGRRRGNAGHGFRIIQRADVPRYAAAHGNDVTLTLSVCYNSVRWHSKAETGVFR